jgi:hypothetical protein
MASWPRPGHQRSLGGVAYLRREGEKQRDGGPRFPMHARLPLACAREGVCVSVRVS